MPLLVTLNINAVDFKISNEIVALESPYNVKIFSFTPPKYAMDKKYGGFVRLNYGKIEFWPDLFENDWPPPLSCPITVKYTDTTEAAAVTLYTGTAHITSLGEKQVTYNLFATDYTTDLLSTIVDYNGDTVPLPRAFGTVSYVTPVRTPDQGGKNTYHVGGIGTPQFHDDGVNVASTTNGDGTYSLTLVPVGDVSISGTGSQTDLVSIFTWATGASFLNLTLDTTDDRSPSPSVNFWADQQKPMVDFLSELSAFFTHLYYVSGTTLYLVDMGTYTASSTITEFDFFPSNYVYNPPLKSVDSTWIKRTAGFWANVTPPAAYVKEETLEEIVETSYPYALQEISLTPFTDVRADINDALDKIIAILIKPRVNLKIPLAGDLPTPGKRIQWVYDSLEVSTTSSFICRNLSYNFDNLEVSIEGDGVIS